jgi:replicative DNA helicase
MNLIDEKNLEANYLWAIVNRSESFDVSITPEHFSNLLLKSIYTKIHSLNQEGLKTWDLTTIYLKLNRAEDKSWISAQIESPLLPTLIPIYSEELKKQYSGRMVEQITNAVMQEKGELDPFEVHKRLGQKLTEATDKDNTKDGAQVAKEIFAHLESAFENGGLTGIPCGFRQLNDIFNGFQSSRLYVLAARPSMGKSALTLNFLLSAATSEARAYMHCLEESMVSFSSRILSNLAFVDNESIQRGRILPNEWTAIAGAAAKLAKFKIHINDKTGVTARQICDSVRKLNNSKPVNIVFVDHLQDIARTQDSWHHDISESCAQFKQLAKDLKIPVVLVSQLNRGVEQRQDKRPLLSDLKESGDIEAKADVVVLLYRDEYYNPNTIDKGILEVKISKNRDGRLGMLRLAWDPSHMKFKECY